MAARIVPLTTLDPAPEAASLAERWNDVFVASTVATMGDDHDAWSLASRRARESSTSWDHRYYAALDDDGRVVAGGVLSLPLLDNPGLALVGIAVHPDQRRQGVGSAVLGHVAERARDAGRTVLAAETAFPEGGVDPGEAFARLHGFALAQVNHRNDLDVARHAVEEPTDTPGYVVETSTDDTLDEWLEDRAVLQQRMSTDAPIGDLAFEEEDWDAERVKGQRQETRRSGRRAIESVARHLASGRLVAYTQLQVPVGEPDLAYQQDTLVLREHRGHGLGAAVKAANLRALRAEFPQTRTVRTWNAQENGPMIRVNEALGYRTTAIQREWQKRLA